MLTPETNSLVNQKVVSTAQYLRKKEEQEQKSDRRKNHTQNLQSFQILESIADGFFALDRYWRFIYINQRARNLFSKTQQELIGQVIWEELPEFVDFQCEQEYRKAVSENIPVNFEAYYPSLELWVEVRAFPTEDGLVVYFFDITKHKKTEEARLQSEAKLREQAEQLKLTLHQLQATQSQLVQHEKMSSLGQLVAGIAHEINNPVNFIYGNLTYANAYAKDLLSLLTVYEKHCPEPIPEIQDIAQNIDLEFVRSDFPNLVESMRIGAERIRQIVISLRNFARLDEDGLKAVDLHEGIDSTLLILQHRLNFRDNHPGIQVIKNYSLLPSVECFPGQLNQVFMHLISNAIEALEENPQYSTYSPDSPLPTLWISTKLLKRSSKVAIKIRDNGIGMNPDVIARLFDPFFTTKPVGKGTGLGLSICYQIIVNHHHGHLSCTSEPGKGSEFTIELPIFRRH